MEESRDAQVFSEVILGPLLGRGSFGRVHRGSWYAKPVAVKVSNLAPKSRCHLFLQYNEHPCSSMQILEQFYEVSAGDMAAECEDNHEAMLTEMLDHPNVVRTFQHATRVKATAGENNKPVDDADPAFNNSRAGCLVETWLILEYCNKGSLQVCALSSCPPVYFITG